MENQKVARIFQEIGDILELKGENRFRYLSYHRASQTILTLNVDVRQIYDEDPKKFQDIPGIGDALASKIVEILETGKCKEHQQLLAGFKKSLLELLTIRGLGPKKVKKLYDELGIDDIHKLKAAAEKGLIAELEGMGKKSQAEILKSIEDHARHRERVLIHVATLWAEEMVAFMKKCPEVKQAEYAGSLRRGNATIGDVDILTTGKHHGKIIDHFVSHPEVETILAQGDTKASVVLDDGTQVDLRVVDQASFGAALYYFTGSKAHNIHTRKIAIIKGLKINEYGVYKGEKRIAGKTEKEIFKTLGLPYIVPELREDWGEIEAGYDGKLPKPVELKDIRGDLHMHTENSDGQNSIEEMVVSARSLGYEYVAISDHSPAVRVANGMNEKRLLNYIKEIDALNKKMRNFRILKASEVDIHEDGALDFPDELLAKLDLVNISVHSKFNLPGPKQTERVIKAMSNPYVTILCHPTGQIIKEREPFDIDIVALARAAKKYHVALEVNGSKRLDLTSGNCKLAKDHAAKFVINTDAHQVRSLEHMRFGVKMARRGWLEKKDVLNTQPLDKLLAYFKRPKK